MNPHDQARRRRSYGGGLSQRVIRRRTLMFAAALAAVLAVVWLCRPADAQQPTGAAGDVAQPVEAPRSGRQAPAPAPADADGAGPDRAVPKASAIPVTPVEMLDALQWPFATAFLLASVIALWFGIERIVVLRRGRVIPRPFVERFLQHLEQGKLDAEAALQLCQQNGSPVAHVFAHGVRKWGKPSVEVEQAIIDGGERQVSHLRNHLRVLNGVASIAPLIGLFGTVVGMIISFNEIGSSNAMGKANELAGGIAVALLTTAVGLAIAIPSLVLYMYLAGRVDSLVMEMDELAQNVVHLISAEALAREPVAAPKTVAAHRVPSKPHTEPQPKKRAV
ncbi:MAG TPA: MotA/TolQ/ExbB proton channel family protein [Planctomycetaceae bacterium]|nr:MotA/TolQ/ExbB proton channel family protein [Planctomycetaceae bacterium]